MSLKAAPPPAHSGALGQALEFAVWTSLIAQSNGWLHVFLPLIDRGLDGVVHRLTDGAYISLQVKGRTELGFGSTVHVAVRGDSLVDDSVVVIVAWLHQGALGPAVLVVPEADLKRLAYFDAASNLYMVEFGEHPASWSRWRPFIRGPFDLAAALMGEASAPAALPRPAVSPAGRHEGWLGFLGEIELVRRLAESPGLDLYRPFPDIEAVDLLIQNNDSRLFHAIQVKTVTYHRGRPAPQATIELSDWRPAPTLSLVVLAWLQEAGSFHEECLVIPSLEVDRAAVRDGDRLKVEFLPGSRRRTRLDPYRRRLAELTDVVERATSSTRVATDTADVSAVSR